MGTSGVGYKPPGVYPEKERNAGMTTLWQGARVPVIVGRGQRQIQTTSVIAAADHTAGGVDTLPYAATSIIRVGDYPDQIRYVEDTDFLFDGTVASPSASIDWSPTGVGVKEPDSTYYVTYWRPVESTQYDFHLYSDENELLRVHGQESTDNLVSVGGVVALRNGTPFVGIIQLDLETAAGSTYPAGDPDNPTPAVYQLAFAAALLVLEELDTDQCRYVVPMTTLDDQDDGVTIWADYMTHVDKMSLTTQRRWRMLIKGMSSSTASNGIVRDLFVAEANNTTGWGAHNSARRMIVVSPGEVYRVIRDSTGIATETLFDGSVLAAAAAGRICAFYNPAVTITWKDFSAISLRRTFSNADMNIMAANGVCVFWYKGKPLKCRHGITTSQLNANEQEISIVEIEDWIKIQSIWVLENRYIGSLIVSGLTQSVRASVISYWEQMVIANTIYEFDESSVSVSQDTNDPRIINIFGRIKPAYPLNWIDLTFQFYAGSQ